MDMGTQGAGRKRLPNRERLTAEDDALNQIAREAEARLAAKRAARAEAREIRMKELERQQKEIYQVQKKYYGLDTKWGDIEQWMEDSERHSRRPRRSTSASDEDERMSVGSRGSLRPDVESGGPYAWTNGYDGELYGSQSLSRRSGRNSSYSGDGRSSTLSLSREEKLASEWEDSSLGGTRRGGSCAWQAPSEHSGHLSSSSRASSRASSARGSPVVEERPEKDFTEKGSRSLPGLSAATLASLGGTSARRGSGDTSVSVDTEASIREIKELNELKDQIQDVEGKYMQGLKEMKDSLAEVEEKYKKAMVSNAQLDNEKTNYMYQVDTLKDTLLDLEEQLAESRRQCEEKSKEFEREKHAHSLLRFQLAEMKAALQHREEMLQEIRQLQQKQASYVREISDLQETIEWKDKKIGALERQKEFFDSVRSERDDLREEVGTLKAELKKHGIILNAEVATNGETPDALTNVGHHGPTQTTKGEPPALQATRDGTLGKATEVEVDNEIVDSVGNRETLQSTEREPRREDPVEDGADTEVFPPGDSAKDQRPSDDSAPSLAAAANAAHEDQIQSQVLGSMSALEHTEQVGSSEGTGTADAGAGAPLEPPEGRGAQGGGMQGPEAEQGSCDASEAGSHSAESAEMQEPEKRGCGTSLGEASPGPRQGPAPSQIPEADAAQAGPPGPGEPLGTVASRPPRGNDDTDVPKEGDPSTGCGLETGFTNQGAAGPREPLVQSTGLEGGGDAGEAEGKGSGNAEPVGTEAQSSPPSPAAARSAQGVPGPRTAGSRSELLDVKDPGEDNNDPQGECLDSPQKKTKNKKKKKNKKKSPAPAETPKEAKEEPSFQSPGLSEAKEEEQVGLPDERPGEGIQDGVPGNPQQNTLSGSGENQDVPEYPNTQAGGGPHLGGSEPDTEARTAAADGEPVPSDGDAVQAAGSQAGAGGLEEGGGPDGAKGGGVAPRRPPEDGDASGSVPLGDQSPSEDVDGAPPAEGTEHASRGVGEVPESLSPGSDGLAPAGYSCPESRGEAGHPSEKDKSKEDCTLS
ncbi:leucine-rich repeat flightless-interacting protein 1 isoform X4 [Pteronotus mesoamericanus]|uniref:leucine-rich repeat flightless-interacting protein 1 isoform X4 n=1 Tax=Pteronotus mesoamericanus TaxID=1884717 RepID=UPI0023EB250D|nr:leucine-rich repeat flightless-interacting protein 1 isoform X4 [Pteronotus parnellii mesoamericanus]